VSKRKTLGQIGYEAAFRTRRLPYAHDAYPPAWDRITAAIERAVIRRQMYGVKCHRSNTKEQAHGTR
jgi:hypothetical protein